MWRYQYVDSVYIKGGAMLNRLWRGDRLLTMVGLVNLAALAAFLVGMAVDPRIITGAPAWLKPAKFAASIAIYTLTLAWLFSHLPAWPRIRRIVSWTTAAAMLIELVIIALQAYRGTTSHFNVGTGFDAVLWIIMGVAIVVQTVTSIAVAVALWRERFADRAFGWALRLGMVITIVGAFTGGMMTGPTPAQLEAARKTGQSPAVVGAHTVGGPDGGPGLPATGWSTEHGDVRVAHFIGLHAIQLVPLVLMLSVPRRLPEASRAALAVTIALSYAGLFALLLWQALRGQSLLAPDATTLAGLATWMVVTAAAALASVRRRGRPGVWSSIGRMHHVA